MCWVSPLLIRHIVLVGVLHPTIQIKVISSQVCMDLPADSGCGFLLVYRDPVSWSQLDHSAVHVWSWSNADMWSCLSGISQKPWQSSWQLYAFFFAVCGKTKNTQSSIKLANPKFTHQCFWKCLKWQDDFSPDEHFASDGLNVYEWAEDPKARLCLLLHWLCIALVTSLSFSVCCFPSVPGFCGYLWHASCLLVRYCTSKSVSYQLLL